MPLALRFPLSGCFILMLSALPFERTAVASDFRYSVQLDDPTQVIRTDRETGATLVCRNTGHAVWCPPTAETCRTVLDKVQVWRAEQDLPSQQEVIDCLQRNLCDRKPPQRPPLSALPGTDELTLTYCLDHQSDQRPD
jgi:hypothetical protein